MIAGGMLVFLLYAFNGVDDLPAVCVLFGLLDLFHDILDALLAPADDLQVLLVGWEALIDPVPDSGHPFRSNY